MKKFLPYIITLLSVISLTAVSCVSEPDEILQPGSGQLEFRFSIPGQTVMQTRSIDPDGEPVTSVWLFLFNESGYYIGHIRATDVTYSGSTSSGLDDNGHRTGTFHVASIPGSTRIIHFIANYNAADINDSELINRTEAEVMTRFTSASGRLVYWGRKTYTETPTSTNTGTVTFYRNQASITYRIAEDVDLSVEGFAVCNAYMKGTVVPYNRELQDPFGFSLGEGSSDFVTLCSGDDFGKSTDPSDIEERTEWYVFEHDNSQDDMIYTIFKIRYKGDADNDYSEKYYKLLIADEDLDPYMIVRNHRYIFTFTGIPTTLGYNTFEEARNGVAANNVWVSIDKDLSSIGDGKTSLTIDGETTRIYTEQKDETINFTYSGATLTADQVSATWLANEGIAGEDLSLTYDTGTGEGSITIRLNEISDTPQYGSIYIKAGVYSRTIDIIYLNNFEFAPVWTSSSVPAKSGEDVSIVFNIPETYPEELFPVECKLSCNLFDANTNNTLEVIEERTVFDIDGEQYDYDWDYKYVYYAERPGLHRVDFKTLVNDYSSRTPVWFLEAPYFNTIRREINMVGDEYADKKIIIYETTLDGGAGSGSYEREIAPIKGQSFYLRFRFDGGGTPAGTRVRIYMDENVEPGLSEDDSFPDNLGEEQTAPDAGRYFIYTVPDQPDFENEFYSIPFHTVSAQCAGYARLAAADVDNQDADGNPDPEHCYKSAIVTRVNNPSEYNFNFLVTGIEGTSLDTGAENISLRYGTGREITLSITPDLGTMSVNSCSFFIATENFEPVSGNLVRDEEAGGYIWNIDNLTAQEYSVTLRSTGTVSAETISISETSGNAAFAEDRITVTNPQLTGRIRVEGMEGGFTTSSPFIALEKSDGTRIGAFEVTAATGASSGEYSLILYGEYDFTEEEILTVLYSPLDSGDVYVGSTTVAELIGSPEITLARQQ